MEPGPDSLTPFERMAAVAPAGPGRYRATVDPGWDGPPGPNGGVLTAIMVRAAEAELGPRAPAPRAVSIQFLDAPAHGPAQLDVQILRRGKRVAFCDVRMRQGELAIAQMTIVCSAARAQDVSLSRRPPDVPDPALVAALPLDAVPAPLFEQLEMRPALGPAVFSGASSAVTGGWLGLRDDDAPLDAARLCAFCDFWWPAIFGWLPGPAGAPTLQLTVYLRATQPAVRGPVLARFETRDVQESHFEERGELWSSDGALLAESRQLALLLPLTASAGSEA